MTMEYDSYTTAIEADVDESITQTKIPANNDLKNIFRLGQYIVYAGHGAGKIVDVEEQIVVGTKLALYVIRFERDKMTLRVPTSKMNSAYIRTLNTKDAIKKTYDVFSKKVRIKRAMWSKRAQEYELKINSGDLKLVAEVVRDLYRREGVQEQSYSEKKLYDLALERFSQEVSLVMDMTQSEIIQEVENLLYNR